MFVASRNSSLFRDFGLTLAYPFWLDIRYFSRLLRFESLISGGEGGGGRGARWKIGLAISGDFPYEQKGSLLSRDSREIARLMVP